MSDDEPTIGVSDVMMSAWGAGLMAASASRERSTNPHPVDTEAWREWLRGFEAWETAPKFTIDLPELP